MTNTMNAVRGLQTVFGKTSTQLNKGNLNIKKAMMDLDIMDIENVTIEKFEEVVNYFAEIKSGKYVIPTDFDIDNVDFSIPEKSEKTSGKKGTITQLRAFIESKGLALELHEFVNQA